MNCNVCHRPEGEHEEGLFCCPFCGGSAAFAANETDEFHQVYCSGCVIGTLFDRKDQSKADWNRRASGWIACAGRPPEKLNASYVVLSAGERDVAWYSECGWQLSDAPSEAYEAFRDAITHWMPLPEPPEVEK